MEITAFRCQRRLILQERPGAEPECVKQSNSYEELITLTEAISSPTMRLFIEALVEGDADDVRADKQLESSRTSFYSKLRRLMLRKSSRPPL
jgi:hypothetical protein